MAMDVRNVTIKGLSPGLLMHRFPLEPVEAIEKRSAEEQAEHSAYRIPDTKELCIPAICLQRTFIAAATFSKGKGRASLQKVAAACLFVDPVWLGLGVFDYEISHIPVTIPATRGRIIRHRPWLPEWQVAFNLTWDPDLLKETQVRRIVDDGGNLVGVLDFRPGTKGPYGRFMVTSWSK